MSNFDKVLILRLLTVCIRRKIKLSFSEKKNCLSLKQSGRSFMNNINSNGPKIEP